MATIIWIVAIINMMNFLDGLDGLAGGISAISGGTLFLLAILRGQADIGMLAIILVGACLGFLRFNFYPAKVFMGDSGSQVLGFILAMISLVGTLKSTTVATLVITVLALGVPIIDTMQVFITRILRGQPIYQPDRSHVHHRLLRGGLKDWQAVGVLYLVGILFSLLSLLLFIYWV
jgi:UDP-GlcNAc:undecaprenyl-phosphate GlcNAc-1-phosphate transferase